MRARATRTQLPHDNVSSVPEDVSNPNGVVTPRAVVLEVLSGSERAKANDEGEGTKRRGTKVSNAQVLCLPFFDVRGEDRGKKGGSRRRAAETPTSSSSVITEVAEADDEG